MRKLLIAVLACMLLFWIATPCTADTAPSPIAQHMQEEHDRCMRIVDGWRSSSYQQIALALAIGIIGLVVGVLQRITKSWTKGMTVALGTC